VTWLNLPEKRLRFKRVHALFLVLRSGASLTAPTPLALGDAVRRPAGGPAEWGDRKVEAGRVAKANARAVLRSASTRRPHA
jgi:hypothetical protein